MKKDALKVLFYFVLVMLISWLVGGCAEKILTAPQANGVYALPIALFAIVLVIKQKV